MSKWLCYSKDAWDSLSVESHYIFVYTPYLYVLYYITLPCMLFKVIGSHLTNLTKLRTRQWAQSIFDVWVWLENLKWPKLQSTISIVCGKINISLKNKNSPPDKLKQMTNIVSKRIQTSWSPRHNYKSWWTRLLSLLKLSEYPTYLGGATTRRRPWEDAKWTKDQPFIFLSSLNKQKYDDFGSEASSFQLKVAKLL